MKRLILSMAVASMSAFGQQVPPLEPIGADSGGGGAMTIPLGWTPPPVRVAPAGKQAATITREWSDGGVEPLPGADGRVVVTYGSGMTTLLCSHLRVCTIELQPGEKIQGAPTLGDAVRWSVEVGKIGSGSNRTEVLLVKPLLPRAKDLRTETTLVVLTDRRMYYIRLQSDPDNYVARLAFEYPPPGGAANWDEYHTQRAAEEAASADEAREVNSLAATIPTVPIVSADWNYRTRGDSRIRPVAIASDGKQTFLRMPAGLASRGLPSLLIEGQVANYRVQGDWWVVDGIAESGELLVGTGWRQRRASFWKEAP